MQDLKFIGRADVISQALVTLHDIFNVCWIISFKVQLTDIQPIGWFVIEEKPTTFVLGVFILCKFLPRMDKPSRKLRKCHPNVTRASASSYVILLNYFHFERTEFVSRKQFQNLSIHMRDTATARKLSEGKLFVPRGEGDLTNGRAKLIAKGKSPLGR